MCVLARDVQIDALHLSPFLYADLISNRRLSTVGGVCTERRAEFARGGPFSLVLILSNLHGTTSFLPNPQGPLRPPDPRAPTRGPLNNVIGPQRPSG